MPLEQQIRSISLVGAGLAGIAAVSAIIAATSAHQAAGVNKSGGFHRQPGDSPIMASGGSMSFHSHGTSWTCYPASTGTALGQGVPHTACVVPLTPSSMGVEGLIPIDASYAIPAGFGNLGNSWSVLMTPRDPSGNVVTPSPSVSPYTSGTPWVKICTTSSGDPSLASCGGTGYVLLQAYGQGSKAMRSHW